MPADMTKELTGYHRLGFARQLSNTPGMTLDRGRELGAKFQTQVATRGEKFERIRKTVVGEK